MAREFHREAQDSQGLAMVAIRAIARCSVSLESRTKLLLLLLKEGPERKGAATLRPL